jgi:hypothetical protein
VSDALDATNEGGFRAALIVCKTHDALLRPMLRSTEVEIVARDRCELCKLDRAYLDRLGLRAELRTKSGSWS